MITKLKPAAPAVALAAMTALTLLSAIDSASACKGKHDKGGEKPGKVHSQGMPKPPYGGNPGPIGPVPPKPQPAPTTESGTKPTTVVVRDHRAKPIVRDHRAQPVIRDHRASAK